MGNSFYALSLLTPYDVDKPKTRIGPNTDGGYVFIDDFASEQPVMSYGISNEYTFDRIMAERGHPVYMFDHTIRGISGPNERMRFFREGVSGQTMHEESLFTLEDHIARHSIQGDRIILKMDVEGAEFSVFSTVSEAVLQKFEQIVVEVHGVERIADEGFRATFIQIFEKINRYFTLFHVHANNHDGPDTFHFVDGMPVACILELSYIRSDRVNRRASQTVYPTVLDYPNVAQRDKLMWFYPFAPQSSEDVVAAFAMSLDHVQATAPG
jgi:Methyltransferase FkbM domain